MAAPLVDEQTFVRAVVEGYNTGLSNEQIAKKLGYSNIGSFLNRKTSLASKYNLPLARTRTMPHFFDDVGFYHHEDVFTIVYFTDAHIWPEQYAPLSPAYWVMLEIIEAIKPRYVIDGGDSLDGAQISRHPRIGWEKRPSLSEEVDAVRDAKALIESTVHDGTKLLHLPGNHCQRFENYISGNAPALEDLKGTTLRELFPAWAFHSAAMLNDTLYLQHKWKGGKVAGLNNTASSGKSHATGHDHTLSWVVYRDLNGLRHGLTCGMLAWPYGQQFRYVNSNPVNWHCGFQVITLDQDRVYPEPVLIQDNGKAFWRGKFWG